MSLPVQQQLKYWGIASAVFLVALWYLGQVMMPFILGGAIAYFLDPVADRLEAMGLSRVMATVVITLLGFLLFFLLALWVVPTLVHQMVTLVDSTPGYIQTLKEFLIDRFPSLMNIDSPLRQSLDSIISVLQTKGASVLNQILSSAMGILNVLALVFLVPVIAFYLLLDWDRMLAEVNSLLPREHADTIRDLANQINLTLSSFIRGQGTVCLILGAFYAISLMLAGLQFGLVVGVVAGALTFIPYVGALVGGGLAIGLALFQFWGDWTMIGVVAGIFAFGQVMEGNFLSPKLVGSSVGLHPVWLIFALSAFGTVFGFVGMLVAVPVAAVIGVLVRFGIRIYLNSKLYLGPGDGDGENRDAG